MAPLVDGTLLTLQGSIVGLGTDIGGSARISSHVLGLYSLKPSASRPAAMCIVRTVDALTTVEWPLEQKFPRGPLPYDWNVR